MAIFDHGTGKENEKLLQRRQQVMNGNTLQQKNGPPNESPFQRMLRKQRENNILQEKERQEGATDAATSTINETSTAIQEKNPGEVNILPQPEQAEEKKENKLTLSENTITNKPVETVSPVTPLPAVQNIVTAPAIEPVPTVAPAVSNDKERSEEKKEEKKETTPSVTVNQVSAPGDNDDIKNKNNVTAIETTVQVPELNNITIIKDEKPEPIETPVTEKPAAQNKEEIKPQEKSNTPKKEKKIPTGKVVEIPVPKLDTSDTTGVAKSLAELPPTSMIMGVRNAGPAVDTAKKNEKSAAKNNLPVIDQPTGLSREDKKNVEKAKVVKGKTPDIKVKGQKKGKTPDPKHKDPATPVPGTNIKKAAKNEITTKEGFFARMATIPTKDPGIVTDTGPRPKVDLTGEANPNQNDEHKQQTDKELSVNKSKADNAIHQDFGENDIYPDVKKDKMKPNTKFSKPTEWQSQLEEDMPPITAEMQATMDPEFEKKHQAEIDAEMAKQEQAQQEYEAGAEEEKAKGLEKIDAESEKVKEQQLAEQGKSRKEVDKHRADWKKENEKVKQDYENSSSEEKKRIDSDINTKVEDANKKAGEEMDKANEEVEKETVKTETKAEEKKQEAENKDKSWWDRAIDAVSDFFNELKEAVSKLFDELRKAVKFIIDKAKKWVNDLIDSVRDMVVGMIKAFGEILKKFVSIALAAFPELAEKFNKYIEEAVNEACEFVNKLAEGLKKFANAVLDAIGDVINAILDVFQACINFFLDVLEFLTVGLIKITRGIARLFEAASIMPDFLFWEQIVEAMFGMNPSDPLPVIERTGDAQALTSQNTEQGPLSETDMKVLSKEKLDDEDVEVDPVLGEEALDKEAIEELSEWEEGEYDFEGSENPITLNEIKSQATGEEQIQPAAENVAQEETVEKSDPDFSKMNDDQKLAFYLGEMKQQKVNVDDEAASGKEQQPESQEEIPDVAKVGPLPVSKRLDFIVEQMKIGIQQWWDDNKGWIIPTLIVVLLGLIVVIVLTGGAAIMAIVTALMEGLTLIFGAMLVAQMWEPLKDYFSKSWDGDIKGGGRSLAKAFAIGLVELILTVVFKGIGKLFKLIGKGAKMALKGIKFVTKKVVQGVRKISSVLIRNGKIIIKNIESGALKGLKKSKDIMKKLTTHLRMKIGRIKITAEYIIIELSFNPSKIVIKLRKKGGKFTEPDLGDRVVVKKEGVTVEHYYKGGDHGPPHVHVKGGGGKTRVGQNGKPLEGDPELTPLQEKIVREHIAQIRKIIKQIGKYNKFNTLE